MVLAFELILQWPLEGPEDRQPWGVWQEGRWEARVEDVYVMGVSTLYDSCERKCVRRGGGRENRARLTLNPKNDLYLHFHI